MLSEATVVLRQKTEISLVEAFNGFRREPKIRSTQNCLHLVSQ